MGDADKLVEMLTAVLESAKRGELTSVAVVGLRPDGEVAVATVNTSRLAMVGALTAAWQGMASRAAGNLYLLTDELNW